MNHERNNNVAYESFFMPLLFTFLLINTLYRSQYDAFFPLGDVTTTVSMIGMLVILIKSIDDRLTYPQSMKAIYFSMGLFMAVYTASYFTYHQMDLLDFFRLLLFFLFILGSVRMKWTKQHLKIAGYLFSVATILFFLHWLLAGLPLSGFKSIFRNENYLGVLLFCFLYFNVLAINYGRGKERLYFTAVTLLNLIIIIPTSARSILIAIAVIIGSWIILKSFRRHFGKLFYIVMAGNILFITAYVGLSKIRLGAVLNDFSYSIFGKNLFSGRNEIWVGIVRALMEKPFFGLGVGTHAYNLEGIEKTSHNMYLQVFIETGLVGLLVFILVLWSLWRLLNKRLNNAASKWSACFMLGILVYNNFELTLMQNNYSIAMFQWLIMTIGISFINPNERFVENKLSVIKN